MADDDTTPIALRRWLLRRDTTRASSKTTTKSAVLRRLVAFICAAGLAWHLCTFENAADLRFFGGIGLALTDRGRARSCKYCTTRDSSDIPPTTYT